MSRTILSFLLFMAVAVCAIRAEPKSPKTRSAEAVRQTFDFNGEETSKALRMIARVGKINLVAADDISGTLKMRIEDRTPREVMEIVASACDLVVTESGGVYFVKPKSPPPPVPPRVPATDDSVESVLATTLSPALIKFYDSVLEFQCQPETAKKIARSKKVLYDALIAEGFTKDEAFRLILVNPESTLPSNK